MSGDRKRILVLNQYYRPGVEATANLLAQLCEELAETYDVTVVTGRVHGREDLPDDEVVNGVRVLRTRSTAYDRTQLSRRAVNYFTYLGDSLLRGLTIERPDVVVCMTDPPIVGDLGVLVARRFRVPLVVISQDVFPEFAAQLGRLRNPTLLRALRSVVRFYLRRADRVVAIGETMRERLIEKGASPESVVVIPNWSDTNELLPQPRRNAWALEQNLDAAFVVMHSGNVGHAQDLDTLMYAADQLRDLRDVVVVVAGMGARFSDMAALAGRLGLPNVRFLPYQPRERLSESLSTADVHVVGLAPGLAGYVVPSRLTGIMSVGRPIIAAADAESETARVVTESGAGMVVPPGQPHALAEAIRDLHGRRGDLEEMGKRGRAYAEREIGRDVAVARYRQLLDDVLAGRDGGGRAVAAGGPEPIRVLRVIARLNIGGPALHVSYLTRELDRRGYETTLVAGRLAEGEASMSFAAEEQGVEPLYVDILQREIALRTDSEAVREFVRLIRRLRPHVIHTHTAKAGAIVRTAALVARLEPRPVLVHTFHGHVLRRTFDPLVEKVFRGIERRLAKHTDALVVVAPQLRDDLVGLGIAPPEKFEVIRLGIDLDRRTDVPPGTREAVREELGAGESSFVVGWFARMTPVKSPDVLVRAFASLRRRGVDGVLALAGDGPLRPELEALAAELGVAEHVRFLGFREDVGRLYAACDAVALSSKVEGTPVTLIEALAAGKPVVSTEIDGVADVVHEDGVLVPLGDHEALAAGLERLARDPELRAEMGRRGAKRVRRDYAVSRLVDDVDRLYRRLLAERGERADDT